MLKLKFKLGILLILVVSILLNISLVNKTKSLNEEISLAYTNLKAYAGEVTSLKDQSRLYKLTIDQLHSYQDSINKKLIKAQKDLKLKDKEIAFYSYLAETATRTDTIIVKDTLFINPTLNIDTLIGDKWFSAKLNLKYPNIITVTPRFQSSLSAIGHLKKETIKPPKKCFIGRWFQKKHTVLIIDVKEENPWVDSINRRFIQIVR